ASQKFVPLLRLYDARGSLVASSGEGGDALEGQVSHMVVSEGLYRLQVSSLGDGGGGEFHLSLQGIRLKGLAVGGGAAGGLAPGGTDYGAFDGKEGQTVFLSARSSAFEPVVSLRSPDGVSLVADERGSAATGSLLAVKLPRSGRYTVWVSS